MLPKESHKWFPTGVDGANIVCRALPQTLREELRL